jgi:hypothetical protein
MGRDMRNVYIILVGDPEQVTWEIWVKMGG